MYLILSILFLLKTVCNLDCFCHSRLIVNICLSLQFNKTWNMFLRVCCCTFQLTNPLECTVHIFANFKCATLGTFCCTFSIHILLVHVSGKAWLVIQITLLDQQTTELNSSLNATNSVFKIKWKRKNALWPYSFTVILHYFFFISLWNCALPDLKSESSESQVQYYTRWAIEQTGYDVHMEIDRWGKQTWLHIIDTVRFIAVFTWHCAKICTKKKK